MMMVDPILFLFWKQSIRQNLIPLATWLQKQVNIHLSFISILAFDSESYFDMIFKKQFFTF